LPAFICERISRRRSSASSAWRAGQGFVLADEAAQVSRQLDHALLDDRIVGVGQCFFGPLAGSSASTGREIASSMASRWT